jgi:hypothetical protein
VAKLNEYEQRSLLPPRPEATQFTIQRLGLNTVFSGLPDERYFRVWDYLNVRSAVYWLRRGAEGCQFSTPGHLLRTPTFFPHRGAGGADVRLGPGMPAPAR